MTDGTGTTAYGYNPIAVPSTLGAGQLANINAPLATNTFTSTIDAAPPTSSVTTLPATTWRLFMQSALEGSPNVAFPSPLSAAQFAPWGGRYAYRPALTATVAVTSSP